MESHTTPNARGGPPPDTIDSAMETVASPKIPKTANGNHGPPGIGR